MALRVCMWEHGAFWLWYRIEVVSAASSRPTSPYWMILHTFFPLSAFRAWAGWAFVAGTMTRTYARRGMKRGSRRGASFHSLNAPQLGEVLMIPA